MSVTGEGLLRLAATMDLLRSPGGCPWDAEQTHESLVQYLIEETYETIDAIDSGDREHLLEELGDLLLQVFFHARIAEEADVPFNIDDVANGISDKLIRRHPHVFASDNTELVPVVDAADVEANWQAIKNAEKQRANPSDGVPVSLPPLTQAAKLFKRIQNAAQPLPVSAAAQAVVANAEAAEIEPEQLILAAIAALIEQGKDPEALLRSKVSEVRAQIPNY